jgi:hypothetical protein
VDKKGVSLKLMTLLAFGFCISLLMSLAYLTFLAVSRFVCMIDVVEHPLSNKTLLTATTAHL